MLIYSIQRIKKLTSITPEAYTKDNCFIVNCVIIKNFKIICLNPPMSKERILNLITRKNHLHNIYCV